ncbi:MAG TPA: N-acetylmuramoyl-L-alanine amidase [Verrucomicrobiae bacterium]|nr:N-acetylmuramoyl-L-alanine amidase [Verrucomicrobiae bacterium]
MKTTISQRGLRWGALVLLAAFPATPALARAHHSEAWARDRFAAAQRMQEALNGRPPAERTRRDYQRVINAYRNVYYGAPTSTKADPSVVAVAETLVEMGRHFDDDKILNSAIGQYKFLRKEYPGSKYRCDALFTIGEIYKDDLDNPDQARAVFQEFLHRYPHNRLVDDARQAIAELDQPAEADKKEAQQEPQETKHPKTETAKSDVTAKTSPLKADAPTTASQESSNDTAEPHPARLPRVTGIRHWSTPDYTRVAIDVESDVKFFSQRISHPDRIFFDLRDTKLASTLVGKSFDVDDGFLKKIRVAQFQPGRTRVVLEVDDLSRYDAFMLPNPYRLIIDIHGKDSKTARSRMPKSNLVKDVAASDVEESPVAGPKADSVGSSSDAETRAGKTQVADESPQDSATLVAKGDAISKRSSPAVHASGQTTEVVKKVIVPADDDDESSPTEAAKADIPRAHTRSSASLRKAGNSSGDDSDSNNNDADAATASHAHARSTTRLSGRRNDSGLNLKTDANADASGEVRATMREAKPTASGDRSLIRALGLKIGKIVIDPGHGGHDTGTIGPDGLEEKDLVLDVGKRLGKLLESRLGAEVVYTRKDDTFIPLETRTAIANQQRADLFISIHANSSDDPMARGVETYYLNFTSSPDALDVAARENAVSQKSIFELQDLVKKIALKEKIEESREFAGDVQQSLHAGLAARSPAIRDRGVKKAPFIVLIGANMPSILAEISFVSNPTDERHLETGEYRQKIAESLYRGIAKYVNGLSGVKLASKMDKTGGQ